MAIESMRAKRAWLELQNRIIQALNEQVKPRRCDPIPIVTTDDSGKSLDFLVSLTCDFLKEQSRRGDTEFRVPLLLSRSWPHIELAPHTIRDAIYYILRAFREPISAEVWRRDVVEPVKERIAEASSWFDSVKANGADSRADNKKPLPKNSGVTELIRRINENSLPNVSDKAIALDYTKGDEKKADSLLRQARRFRHLREEAE